MARLTSAGLNETFGLLEHPYRRYVLYHLTTESTTETIASMAAAIALWDDDVTGTDRTTIETCLHHIHLPKLVEAGLITLGAKGNAIELNSTDGFDGLLTNTALIDGYRPMPADD